ncbi:MAG: DNA-binding response regulator [Marinilabiliales bacterium]|nr:MAG: DNA-binding response regulator [Marinilabiliales bacterium]
MNKEDTILVIDDELQIRRLLQISLSANGYKVIMAEDGKSGLREAATGLPNLILLDLGLPDQDGLSVLNALREWYTKPIIILSVRKSEEDIIAALDSGANDYLTKPFRPGELLARIRAAMRIGDIMEDDPVIITGDLIVDISKHTVHKNNKLIKLTNTEYSLLTLLAKNRGRVLTHQFLLKETWGRNYQEQTQYLRVFVAALRKKIEDNPNKPKYLQTESGIGYRFSE